MLLRGNRKQWDLEPEFGRLEAYLEVGALILVAIGGVGIIWLALYWTGSLKIVLISDIFEVMDHIRQDAPEFRVSEVIVAADRKTALAANAEGDCIALVFVMGDKINTKLLGRSDRVRPVLVGGRADEPLTLHLETNDFTVPKVAIALEARDGGNLVLRWQVGHSESGPAAAIESTAKDLGDLWAKRIKALTNSRTGAAADI